MEPGPFTRSLQLEELVGILSEYSRDEVFAKRQMRNLSASNAPEFLKLALVYLARGGTGPAETHLAQLLSAEHEYANLLTDPDQLTEEEAITAASAIARWDVEFYRNLLDLRKTSDVRRIFRILQIVSRDDRAMALVPWLRDLVDDENSRLSSKAASILSRLTRNPMVIQRLLQSSDPRVRANTVEGLWGGNIENTRALLLIAAKDHHHRVAANALVELCRAGEELGRQKLEDLAHHADPRYRAAAAWAIGEIGSRDLLPLLEPLENDPVLPVRLRAGRTARRLRGETPTAVPSAVA